MKHTICYISLQTLIAVIIQTTIKTGVNQAGLLNSSLCVEPKSKIHHAILPIN